MFNDIVLYSIAVGVSIVVMVVTTIIDRKSEYSYTLKESLFYGFSNGFMTLFALGMLIFILNK